MIKVTSTQHINIILSSLILNYNDLNKPYPGQYLNYSNGRFIALDNQINKPTYLSSFSSLVDAYEWLISKQASSEK